MSEQVIIERLQAIMSKDPSELTEGEIVYLRSRRGYLTKTQQKRYASVLDIESEPVDAGTEDTQENDDDSTETTDQDDQTEDQAPEAEDGNESSEEDDTEPENTEDVSEDQAGEEGEEEIDLMKLRRPELEELAAELGVDDPASFPNMGELRKAIQKAYEEAE